MGPLFGTLVSGKTKARYQGESGVIRVFFLCKTIASYLVRSVRPRSRSRRRVSEGEDRLEHISTLFRRSTGHSSGPRSNCSAKILAGRSPRHAYSVHLLYFREVARGLDESEGNRVKSCEIDSSVRASSTLGRTVVGRERSFVEDVARSLLLIFFFF